MRPPTTWILDVNLISLTHNQSVIKREQASNEIRQPEGQSTLTFHGNELRINLYVRPLDSRLLDESFINLTGYQCERTTRYYSMAAGWED